MEGKTGLLSERAERTMEQAYGDKKGTRVSPPPHCGGNIFIPRPDPRQRAVGVRSFTVFPNGTLGRKHGVCVPVDRPALVPTWERWMALPEE